MLEPIFFIWQSYTQYLFLLPVSKKTLQIGIIKDCLVLRSIVGNLFIEGVT
jgi:hypothetical protein